MAKLIYTANTSLDGYIEDKNGSFDWAVPDEEVHKFWNDVLRPVGTHLYGRRLYEVMSVWETMGSDPNDPAVIRDFASVWRPADKVVYSRTLAEPATPKTRIEPSFDPEAVRAMKATAATDLLIGGPELAAEAFRAGLVDECQLVIHPVSIGGGKPALPMDLMVEMELLEERRFASGAVNLHYQVK